MNSAHQEWSLRQHIDADTIDTLNAKVRLLQQRLAATIDERDRARRWARAWKCKATEYRSGFNARNTRLAVSPVRIRHIINPPPADIIELIEATEAAGCLSEEGRRWLSHVREHNA